MLNIGGEIFFKIIYLSDDFFVHIGVSQKLISIWETGRQELPVRQARKLAEVLGCDWKELYDY